MLAHPSKNLRGLLQLGGLRRGLALFALSGLCGGLLAGCGQAQGEGGPLPTGRVAMRWTLDGATLEAARCQAVGISYMDVEVLGLEANGSIAFTNVQCDLDRYSLAEAPLGKAVVRVGGMVKDSKGNSCLKYYGETPLTTTQSYPATPTNVRLYAAANCR